jgi:hypothetical protein
LTKYGGKQFHLRSPYNEINQIEREYSQKNIDGNTSPNQLVDLVQQNGHQGNINQVNPTDFEKANFEEENHFYKDRI